MEDRFQPVLDLKVAPGPDCGLMAEDVSILWIEGSPAFLELLVDPAEESCPLPETLGCQT